MVPAQAEMENKMSEMLQYCKAEHPDNPREELEITGIGTGIIGPKHEKVRNVARSNILKTQNRTTLKLSPSWSAPGNLQHIKSCNMLQILQNVASNYILKNQRLRSSRLRLLKSASSILQTFQNLESCKKNVARNCKIAITKNGLANPSSSLQTSTGTMKWPSSCKQREKFRKLFFYQIHHCNHHALQHQWRCNVT